MAEQLEQLETVPGNTESGTSKKSRGWFFTFNNPDDIEVEQLEHLFVTAGCSAYVFQLEMGEEDTPHYQGSVYFKNPVVMPKYIDQRIHWEFCRNWRAAVDYCSKEDTRIAGPWFMGVKPKKAPLKVISELRPWQAEIATMLREEPDDRSVYWFWESVGNVGKTAFAKWIAVNFNALILSGKCADMKYAVAQYVRKRPLKVAVICLARANEEFVSYEALEVIKDGMFFSGKYEADMVLYNSPHVIVFANFAPKMEMLSSDRWNVKEIGAAEAVVWG